MWKHQTACKGTDVCVGPWQSRLDSNTTIGANGEHGPLGLHSHRRQPLQVPFCAATSSDLSQHFLLAATGNCLEPTFLFWQPQGTATTLFWGQLHLPHYNCHTTTATTGDYNCHTTTATQLPRYNCHTTTATTTATIQHKQSDRNSSSSSSSSY